MKVVLGFKSDGHEFEIPIQHTVITGMTGLSGKTTTEEAILDRSEGFRALVFLTKRGEKTFDDAPRIAPFYKERFDWEYVRGLLESAMRERMKFETPWIIRICKRASSLADVRSELKKELGGHLRDFDRNIFTLLLAYLDKVLPTIESSKAKFVSRLDLKDGVNVMDLTEWYTHEEVQMLIIRSCMEQILEKENNVIVALPEAWKMLPQARNTPVKLYFEKFIREGATNNNYLMIDAQDLGGIDKTPLRQVSVWIMGKMMETNEVERLIKQTLGLDVQPETIQKLPLGWFLVACGDKVEQVYVWARGVPREMALAVAKGELSVDVVKEWILDHRKKNNGLNGLAPAISSKIEEIQSSTNEEITALRSELGQLRSDLKDLSTKIQERGAERDPSSSDGLVDLQKTNYYVHISENVKTCELSDEKIGGKIMFLAREGLLKDWKTQQEIEDALTDHRWSEGSHQVWASLQNLIKVGYIGRSQDKPVKYALSPNVKFVEGSE
jgi:hypothetical protein